MSDDAAPSDDAGVGTDAAAAADAAPETDAAPEADAAAPPPAPVICDGLPLVDFFAEAESVDGQWYLTLEDPETASLEPAECGGGEDAVIVGFRAPYDGYWLFDTGGARTDFDPVVRSHVGCPDQDAAETCVDDDQAFAPVLGGYLAAGEARHFVVSAWAGVPGTVDLIARRVPLVEGGAGCTDNAGSACDADHTCVPREADPEVSVCEPRTPPVLEAATARRQGDDAYTLTLEGRDEGRDIWGLAIQYLDADQNPITLNDATTFYAEGSDPPRTAAFRLGFRFSGLSEIPGVTQLRVAAVDATGAESTFLVAAFEALTVVGLEDPCDPTRVVDVCPNSFTCNALTARCGPARAPTVIGGAFHLNREEATWGLVVEGTDENADVVAIRFLVLDRRRRRIELDGADTGDLVIGDRLMRDGDTWRFTHSGNLPRSVDPSEVGYLQFIAIDQTGLTSEDEVFAVSEAPERALGAPCDGSLALDRCPRGARCQYNAAGESVCRAPVYACPPGTNLFALTVGEPVTGNTFGAPISAGHLTCAPGMVGLHAYRFVAPETGDYAVTADADFEVINYVTRSCLSVRYGDELACEVGDASSATLTLQADQVVYLRVGGVFTSREADEAAYKAGRGTYQLTVERLP